jgi:peptidoglycan-associated lipoprotein
LQKTGEIMKAYTWKIVALAFVLTACKSTPTDLSHTANPTSKQETAAEHAVGEKDDGRAYKIYGAYLSNRQVFFDYNSDTFNPKYKNLIAVHAKYLLNHPQSKISLQGHSDERGTPEYNKDLGMRRAVAVKNAFAAQGVKNAQLETLSYGNEFASRDCPDEHCHKIDRRVDISYGVK